MSTLEGLHRAARALRVAGSPSARLRLPQWLASLRARLIAGAAVVAAVFGGWSLTRPPVVETAYASLGEALDVVYATGVVEHVRRARVSPVVTAPIVRVLVEEGERVQAGQALAQLEDGPARGVTAQLDAQAATARLAAARVDALHAEGFAPRAVWEEARGQRDAARAAAEASRAQLQYFTITAPFSGTVLRRDAEMGDLAEAGEVLFVVADEGALRITIDLDERDIARVSEGQRAIVRAEALPDQSFEATVADITPLGDADARVFRVRLTLPAETPIQAGMTVEANIVAARRQDAVLAPAAAVASDAIWVVRDGRVERRPIDRGAGGDMVEVRNGLSAGEVVVINPPASLRDGARIRIAEAVS
ncbi:MAG: efflux RND transporter periplasmic adaptor subunit [Hyphomonadaceae bacterium]